MQPQNRLSNLLPELLFSCMTGTQDISDRAALKVFLCSHVKETCKDLNQKVDDCWQACLAVVIEEWKISPKHSLQFVKKWIVGKPAFSHQTLYYLLKKDLSIENPPSLKTFSRIPTLWSFSNHESLDILAYTREPGTDISFIDLKKCQFLCELKDVDIGSPLFYENGVFILYSSEIRFYAFETNGLALKTKHALFNERVQTMHILNDYIVFTFNDKIAAIIIEDFKNSDSPSIIYSPTLKGVKSLKAFSSQILIWQEQRFQLVYIENRQFKFNDCIIDGDALSNINYFNYSHVLHTQTQCSIFLFQFENRYQLGAISPDKLSLAEPQIFHTHSKQFQNMCTLVENKNSVLLLSKEKNFLLQIQKLNIKNGKIEIVSLDIEGIQGQQFLDITSATSHLDKLFIMGNFIECGYSMESINKLIIINMATHVVESILELGSANVQSTTCITSSIGKLHFMIRQNEHSCILKVDYT